MTDGTMVPLGSSEPSLHLLDDGMVPLGSSRVLLLRLTWAVCV